MRSVHSVLGMTFHAFHGVLEVERELGQIFSVDVSVEFDVAPKDESPQAEPVIRDADIFEIARNVITETKYRSITNLAGKIARDMMSKYQKLAKAEVAVTRKQLFIPGFIDCSIEKVLLCREDM